MNLDFFKAPLILQLALGGGYLGYLAAYAGIRDHHKQIDVAFLTVAFGLAATLSYGLVEPRIGQTAAIALAVVLSVIIGLAWRRFGRALVRGLLKRGKLSYADDDPSVMTAIFADTQHHVSQVLVTLDDGRELQCANTADFEKAAIAPFIYGADGSVALYVTHVYRPQPDGTQKVDRQEHVRNPEWGDNLTIVPASRIRNVDIRLKKRG